MASRQRVLFGNRVVPPRELLAIADGSAEAVIDASVLDKMATEEARLKGAAAEVLTAAPEAFGTVVAAAGAINTIASRAACAGLLVALARVGQGIRVQVVTCLATMLNDNATPMLPPPSADGLYSPEAVTIATAVCAAVEGLTLREWFATCGSQGCAAGIATVAAAGARELCTAANVSASFCIEASKLGMDAAREASLLNAPKGLVESAAAFRSLLRVSTRAVDGGTITGAAEMHGSARDVAYAADRCGRLEVNAAPSIAIPSGKGKGKGKGKGSDVDATAGVTARPASAVLSSARGAIEAAKVLCEAAVVRGADSDAGTVASVAVSESRPGGRVSGSASVASSAAVAVAREALEAVQSAVGVIAQECASAEAILAVEEAEAIAVAAAKEAARQARAADHAKAEAERAAALQAKVAAMTDEERAAYEAKGAKKAAKKAAKNKNKGKGGASAAAVSGAGGDDMAAATGNNTLGLGVGVAVIWSILRASRSDDAGVESAAAVATAAAPASWWRSILPLAESSTPPVREGDRLAAIASAVFEELAIAGAEPKIAKGTRDFGPLEMRVRQPIFAAIRSIFSLHGAVEIDTPVFERRDTLTGKYGEEGAKLIYDLADQGGELLSLRYDLTVPFARYVAMNCLDRMKRFHMAKVYRRDTPQISKGRFREFYQCDFDVAGEYATMAADAEVIGVACEILSTLPVGKFQLKLNHRGVLDGTLELAGVPANKVRTVCSSIDKLDKEPWADVKAELVEEKGVSESVADRIGELVQSRGEPMTLLTQLEEGGVFEGSSKAIEALAELRTLFGLLEATGCLRFISLDLSLARGLDYYTGVIYEAVLIDGETAVGSIAAGGRYDGLVGMFSALKARVPCVGVSIGIERVFAIVEAKARRADKTSGALSSPLVDVFVAAAGGGVGLVDRLRLCSELWQAGIRAETPLKDKLERRWLENALEAKYPYMCLLGESELADGQVTLKNIATKEQITVDRAQVPDELAKMGVRRDEMFAAAEARRLAGEADEGVADTSTGTDAAAASGSGSSE